ncbi:MAG: hypothetical protein O3A96_11695 [Proteobacteria bacterium]|nr:hypothetical protein [Pseudomonadota bacterium]
MRVQLPEEVLAEFPLFAPDWPAEPADESGGGGALDIAIEAAEGGYLRRTAWGADILLDHARDAANALAGALIEGFTRQGEGLVCLHAGAVRLGPALVLFIGESESGKSSLSLQLAAAGHRFFGDDRILLDLSADPVTGLCFGLAPKVRLPLPSEAGEVFANFVAARTRREMAGQAYLSLAEESAGFGEESPVGALVLADRREGSETSLAPAGRGDLMRALIGQSYAPHIPAERLIARFALMGTAVSAWHLTFHNSREAAATLAEAVLD